MSVPDLTRLEMEFGIRREEPQRILEDARDAQRQLEELAEKHSCELPAWVDLAGSLEDRRVRVRDAIERTIAETMELDDAVFGVVSKTDCLGILRALDDECARALQRRSSCARGLAALAAAYHEEGYANRELLENAVNRAVAWVHQNTPAPEAVAAEYVAELARQCAVPAAGAAPGHRFPDLMTIFGDASRQTTLRDATHRMQQTALGLWPADEPG